MERKRTVLVTGTSTGIGRHCALHLNKMGWRVLAGVRKPEDAIDLAEAASGQLEPVLLDVTDRQQIAEAVAHCSDGLDGLLNNAGIVYGGPLESLDHERLCEQWEVNVLGLLAVTQAFLPKLRAARGRVVNMNSAAGLIASPGMGAYVASKFAVRALGDVLRTEVAPFGIKVSNLFPGAVETPLWEKGRDSLADGLRDLPPDLQKLYAPLYGGLHAFMQWRRVGPEVVSAAVDHALNARRPRQNYYIGMDARICAFMAVMPSRWRNSFLRWECWRRKGFDPFNFTHKVW